MALPDLATTADLSARGITATATTATMLAVASAVVRAAAGSPILSTASTVGLTGWACEQWLTLPGPPVTAVASVEIDGTAVAATDYRLHGAALWRRTGWGTDDGPADVEVVMTHGLAEVPAHIVDLVCTLVAAGDIAAAQGYASHGGVVAEKIDDYSVEFAQGADAVASVMELPKGTRQWLRASFGGSTGMVVYR